MPSAVKEKLERAPIRRFRFIDTAEALADAADRLGRAAVVGCDLEADSMYHFREKVCLIQLYADNQVFIIDPLTAGDLSPLAPLFSSERVRKIFHGADYDIRSLYRDFSFEIRNLFDTQIASRFLGLQETSLEALLSRYFALRLDKRFQKKDWSCRPLPEEMIAYAAEDVAHLLPLAKILEKELERQGRLAWVEEECERLSQVRPADENGSPLFLRFKGAGRFGPRGLAVLEALLQYRKAIAQAKDRPFFKVFSNESILALAKARPLSKKKMEGVGALSERQLQMYGDDLADVIGSALETPEGRLPSYPRKRTPKMDPAAPKRIRALKSWRERRAQELGLDLAVVLTKTQLGILASANPRKPADLRKISELHRWQQKEFGEEILAALRKTG